MKILYVITQLGIGGAENVLVSMANKMNANAHQVEVVSLLNIKKQNFDNNIKVYILDFKNKPLSSFIQLSKIISNYKPDVVHSHCIHANVITRFVRLLTPIKKLVSTAHSASEAKGLIMTAFKYTNFLSNVITNVSSDAVLSYEKNGYISKNIMKVCFNIIDIEKYNFSRVKREKYRQIFNIKTEELVLISIGTMKEDKDYPNLIKAVSLVSKSTTKPFKVFIVGAGELYLDIVKLSKNEKVFEKIIFLGERSDVKDLLSMSDIFILSSKNEGLPTVLIEAAMAKNTIIATNCGGVNDILPKNKNIVPIKNHIALAEMIVNKMNENEDKRTEESEEVYFHVYEKFNSDKIYNDWISLYK